MSLEKIQADLSKAQGIRANVIPVMREFIIDPYRAELSKINSDRYLTQEGQQFKRTQLQNRYEVKVMKDVHEMQRAHDTALIEVKNEAERLLAQPLPKPNEVEQALFNNNLQEVKADVMFAGSPRTALEALQRLANVQQPALAKQAAEQILQLSGGILSNGTAEEKSANKKQLGALHKELFKRSQPQGADVAIEALGRANHLLQTGLVKPVLAEALKEISKDASHYANNPYAYMTAKKDFIRDVEMGAK